MVKSGCCEAHLYLRQETVRRVVLPGDTISVAETIDSVIPTEGGGNAEIQNECGLVCLRLNSPLLHTRSSSCVWGVGVIHS